MGTRRMRLASACPACHEHTVEYTAMDLDVPYFGGLLQTVFICSSCGFRHSDVIHGQTHEPRRWTFRTPQGSDMSVRVVRSTSGTLRIPELGVLIEPGPASEAFVTNIEGILVRIEQVLKQLERDAETDKERAVIKERLDHLEAARNGSAPVTIIVEDPFGNSLIVHDNAQMEQIPEAEAATLARGEITFDVGDLVGADSDDAPRQA
jgi:zinc finger protein